MAVVEEDAAAEVGGGESLAYAVTTFVEVTFRVTMSADAVCTLVKAVGSVAVNVTAVAGTGVMGVVRLRSANCGRRWRVNSDVDESVNGEVKSRLGMR
jgi:hypothetical protein